MLLQPQRKNEIGKHAQSSEMHKQEAVESYGAHPDPVPSQIIWRSNPGRFLGRSLGQPKHNADGQVSSEIIWTAGLWRRNGRVSREIIGALQIWLSQNHKMQDNALKFMLAPAL